MASLQMRAAISVVLVAVVQGDTYMDFGSFSDNACSTMRKVFTLKQEVCESENPVVNGVEVNAYVIRTCDSTHAIDTYYSDSTCTTPLTGLTVQREPLACTQSPTAGIWHMRVCGQTYTDGPTLQLYSDASCSGAPLSSTSAIHGRACFPDGVFSNGAWTEVSETRVMSEGTLVTTRYSTSDCSGTGSESRHTCPGTCAAHQLTFQEGVQTFYGFYSGCPAPAPAPTTDASNAVAKAKNTVAAAMVAAVLFVAKGM